MGSDPFLGAGGGTECGVQAPHAQPVCFPEGFDGAHPPIVGDGAQWCGWFRWNAVPVGRRGYFGRNRSSRKAGAGDGAWIRTTAGTDLRLHHRWSARPVLRDPARVQRRQRTVGDSVVVGTGALPAVRDRLHRSRRGGRGGGGAAPSGVALSGGVVAELHRRVRHRRGVRTQERAVHPDRAGRGRVRGRAAGPGAVARARCPPDGGVGRHRRPVGRPVRLAGR